MKHDHTQFEDLPALPEGERVIWQGKPSYKGLALRSFHIRAVAIYFALVAGWKFWSTASQGVSTSEAVGAAALAAAPGVGGIALLALLAWLFRRASSYTITTKRILFQFGVALPMTMNIPLSKIGNVALRTYRDGSGDIPLKLIDSDRVSYIFLWPHIRPWHLRLPEPSLVSVPDAAAVAAKLAEALSGQPAPTTVTRLSVANAGSSGSIVTTPSTAAA